MSDTQTHYRLDLPGEGISGCEGIAEQMAIAPDQSPYTFTFTINVPRALSYTASCLSMCKYIVSTNKSAGGMFFCL